MHFTERLKGYFSEFGEIVSCLVMKNNETGKSRGFGFVTFRDPLSVKHVLSTPLHQLDGRPVCDCDVICKAIFY